MGALDYAWGRSQTPRQRGPLRSLYNRRGAQPQQPTDSSRQRGFPERFKLDNPFHSASESAVDVFEAAGRFPGQVAETPFSLLETGVRRLTGDTASPLEAIGQIPGVGQAAGFLGEAVERVGNFVPAVLNSGDMAMIREFGDKPDDFELPWATGQREDGVPILGALPGIQLLFSRAKTIGELKAELDQRGFLVDPETGEQRSWDEIVRELRSGSRSTFDWGYAAINDNPLVDLAGRLALDPTNALFLVPGANVGKAAQVGARVAGAAGDAATVVRPAANLMPRLVHAGLRAPRLPAPVVAKEAVAAGDTARVTLRGIASFYRDLITYPASGALRLARSVGQRAVDPRGYLGLTDGALTATSALGRAGQATVRGAQGYAISSAALSASMAAAGAGSGLVDRLAGGNTFFQGIHDFVLDVENNNPLSENSAWVLASAFSFPYGDLVRAGKAGIGPETLTAFGHGMEAALAKKHGMAVPEYREAMGGPEAVQEQLVYLVKHHVRDQLSNRPLVGARITSAPNAAVRAKISDELLTTEAMRLLKENRIRPDDIVARWEDWDAEQGGFKRRSSDDQTLAPDALRKAFDPAEAITRWRRFRTAQAAVGSNLQVLADGVMGLGLRDYLLREQVDNIRERLGRGLKDKDVVSQAAIRKVMGNYPALGIDDLTGFWKNAALPDAKPVTWGQLRRRLTKRASQAPDLDAMLGSAKLAEDRAPQNDASSALEPVEQRIGRLSAELDQHRAADGTLLDTPRSAEIQAELQTYLDRTSEVRKVKRFESDRALVGSDGAKALKSLDQQAALPEMTPALHQTTWWLDAELRQVAAEWERAILEIDPTYTVKALPQDSILVQMGREADTPVYQALRARTLLGELLFDRGPVAPFTGFITRLLAPVKGSRQAGQARQALYQRMIPDGAKPAQVEAWIAKMQDHADAFSFEARGQRFGLYRDVSSLPASAINKAALEAFGPNSNIVQKWGGRFHDLLDTASSAMWRSVRNQARKDGQRGAFARALEAWHEFYLDGPVISMASGSGRLVSKTFYNLFRFLLDPRWIALNLAERNFLSGVEDGFIRGEREASGATAIHASGARRIDPLNLTSDTGWYYGRGVMSHVGRSFDKRRLESTTETLNGLAQTDAVALETLRRRMRRQAEGELASGRAAHARGAIDATELAAIERRANRDIENSTTDLAVLLDRDLYSHDQNGPRRTLTEEAKAILDEDELRVLQPLLNVLYERNEQLWRDVNRLYTGNPERSTLERILNSYWLYWPVSYQLKALKWLGGAMLDGSFGHNNNALLAGRYAVWQEEHRERMQANPAYAAMFEENPELWFMAQMVVPLTPADIGVSLSRPARLAGSWMGWFSEYKQAQGPLTAAMYITDLGPIYTWNLLQDIEDDLYGRDRFEVVTEQESASLPTP